MTVSVFRRFLYETSSLIEYFPIRKKIPNIFYARFQPGHHIKLYNVFAAGRLIPMDTMTVRKLNIS